METTDAFDKILAGKNTTGASTDYRGVGSKLAQMWNQAQQLAVDDSLQKLRARNASIHIRKGIKVKKARRKRKRNGNQ